MLTRTAPILAVANWVIVHSAQFGDQIPTRSLLPIPARIRPIASASTSRSSSVQVQRRPLANSTSASRSGYAATVRSKFAPIVSSRSGTSVSPAAYEDSMRGTLVPPLTGWNRPNGGDEEELVRLARMSQRSLARLPLLVAALLLLFLGAACSGDGGDDSSASDPGTAATDTGSEPASGDAASGTCTYQPDGMDPAKKVDPPPAEPKETGQVDKTIKTNVGDIGVT